MIFIFFGIALQIKKTVCSHQTIIWKNLKQELLAKGDLDVTINFQYFVKKDVEKKGKIKRCLVAESKSVNLSFLLNFIDEILANSIHHRNLLSNLRSAYPKLLQSLPTTGFNIDFSENLNLVLPQEIQSMHWEQAKTNVAVHCSFKKGRNRAIPSLLL